MPSKSTSPKSAVVDAPVRAADADPVSGTTPKMVKMRPLKAAPAPATATEPKPARSAKVPSIAGAPEPVALAEPAMEAEDVVEAQSDPAVAEAHTETADQIQAAAPKPVPEPQFRSPPKMPGHMPGMHGRPQIAPRAMAAKENFVEGDYVVYPTHGVGKVERIATEEIAGHKLELIHITFEENRMTLRVPVSKARTAGLRKLATRTMFDKALALMKGRARIKRTMWSRRAQEYEQKINSGDPMQIAEVVRDLYRNAGQPDQSFSERQIYENAMDRLAAEYAALEQTDKATAMQRLMDDLKTVVKGAAIEVDAEGEEVEPA